VASGQHQKLMVMRNKYLILDSYRLMLRNSL